MIIEKINVRDSLLVDYKHIINTHCIFVGTLEPCVTQLFSTLHNNDLLLLSFFVKRRNCAWLYSLVHCNIMIYC